MDKYLNIVSLNVRGLHDNAKRSTLFHWLKVKNFDIICLQETFCTPELKEIFDNEWHGPTFHGITNSPHSRGVSILFGKNFSPSVHNVHTGEDGRKILINVDYMGQKYAIANIYAPNSIPARRYFYRHIQHWIADNANNENCMIVCGDFNCSMQNMDRKTPSVDASRGSLMDLLTYLKLKDTYREKNKSKPGFTYYNRSGSVQCRIDYIFCSSYLTDLSRNISRNPFQ